LQERWQEVYAQWNDETVEDAGARPMGRNHLAAAMWPHLFEEYDPANSTPRWKHGIPSLTSG
jgi:hypothetical protein